MAAGMEGAYEGSPTTKADSARETIDRKILECKDVQASIDEIVKKLVEELLPPEPSKLPEEGKESPQGWFQELDYNLSIIRDMQKSAIKSLTQLRRAVRVGKVKRT